MSKNIIIAVLMLLVLVLSGATVYASTKSHKIVDLPDKQNTVSTFWHDGNRCYVARSNGEFRIGAQVNNSISCVRYE